MLESRPFAKESVLFCLSCRFLLSLKAKLLFFQDTYLLAKERELKDGVREARDKVVNLQISYLYSALNELFHIPVLLVVS